MHLVLEPDLSVALRLVVGEQHEGRLRARGDVRFEKRQEPCELAALVEPQAHSGALLVLEALFELADQCFEDHPATPGDTQDAGAIERRDVDLHAVVEVR
jgi:hypothetical protein